VAGSLFNQSPEDYLSLDLALGSIAKKKESLERRKLFKSIVKKGNMGKKRASDEKCVGDSVPVSMTTCKFLRQGKKS